MTSEDSRRGREPNSAGDASGESAAVGSVSESARAARVDGAAAAALADPQRRRLLRYLDACEFTASMKDLAEEIAAGEAGTDRAEVTPEERRRVTVKLYHVHVPKLEDEGFLDRDGKSGVVALTEKGERVLRRSP